jgi:hypothetical protein
VLNAYGERSTQLRIDQFLVHKQRFAKIRSKRLQQAVTAIVASGGSEVNPELFLASTEHLPDLQAGAQDGEDSGEPEAAAAAGASSPNTDGGSRGRGRGRGGSRGRGGRGCRGGGRSKGRTGGRKAGGASEGVQRQQEGGA